MTKARPPVYLGLDAGTSGIRAVIADDRGNFVISAEERYLTKTQAHSPNAWLYLCLKVLEQLSQDIDLASIKGMAVDGQSGTVLLCDRSGAPLTAPKFYHEAPSENAVELLSHALVDSTGGVPATLGRVTDLWTRDHPDDFHISHQADWLAGQFCGRFNFSDENNSLKLGFEPATQDWRFEAGKLPFSDSALPHVTAPAQVVGTVSESMAALTGLTQGCKVFTGTTDGIAGFIAASGLECLTPGTAVTSLGTTMVLKAVSPYQVDVSPHGIYSHKLFENWVAGGASNSGGGALLKHFSAEELTRLSTQIDPDTPTEHDFYPLATIGERFPVSDPDLKDKTHPRPDCDAAFLAGLLESISKIEKRGYDLLTRFGVPYPDQIKTVGGGSKNPTWLRIRERVLGVPVVASERSEAAFGAALLAKLGVRGSS